MTDTQSLSSRKALASAWFKELQARFCARFEAVEASADAALYGDAPSAPASFEKTDWLRGENSDADQTNDQGGGTMAMLHGRAIEKAGVHFSCVYGEFSPEFRKQIPGAQEDPRFWASGISLIVHPRNPHAPAGHMNTRMIVTTKHWFGGGGDLNPMLAAYRTDDHEDTRAFHAAMESRCAPHDPAYYARFKDECDRYFYLPHRDEPRGVGGIFYDRLDNGDWDADFAFTKDVGLGFLEAYPALLDKRVNQPWSDEEREAQLLQRGRYAEFNLLYDRGTAFGLKTGGNVDSILSSLPPEAKWP